MPRRSPYSDLLLSHPNLVFSDGRERDHAHSWRDHFGARVQGFNDRLIVDLGCHHATLIAEAASRHPTTAFIGIDWVPRHLFHAAKNISLKGLPNVALLHARVQDLPQLIAPGHADELWLFHPEPLPEPQRVRRRLISPALLLMLGSHLSPTGVLAIKTDHAGYYQSLLSLFGLPAPDSFRLPLVPGSRPRQRDLVPDSELPHASPELRDFFTVSARSADFWHDPETLAHIAHREFAGFESAYERRFRIKNQPIFYLEVSRRRTAPG